MQYMKLTNKHSGETVVITKKEYDAMLDSAGHQVYYDNQIETIHTEYEVTYTLKVTKRISLYDDDIRVAINWADTTNNYIQREELKTEYTLESVRKINVD